MDFEDYNIYYEEIRTAIRYRGFFSLHILVLHLPASTYFLVIKADIDI